MLQINFLRDVKSLTHIDKAAITLKNVSYSADGQAILKNISGKFPFGKISTLVGPSGAGKSTLFRLLNGLKSPESGEIHIFDQPISEYHPISLRRLIGLALQNAPMVSGTVIDNLQLPLKLRGAEMNESEALELLKLVGLNEKFLYHNVQNLSGGQRQKVSIARTLVNKPKILLLDEITSSLDRVSQQDIEELIMRINKVKEVTILWITHNIEQALHVGDYTWVMMNGELVEAGEISLLREPKTEAVRQFVKGEEA